jgi:GT2 family glycosyltransferase
MPRISIILPALNASATIEETIQSLRAQTYRDFEVVLIDDGSTDQTAELALRYAQDIPFQVIRHQLPMGVAESLNDGIRNSDSELIARMDADDLAIPNRLQAQVDLLDQLPEIDICGSAMQVFSSNEAGETYEKYVLAHPCDDVKIRTALLQRCAIAHPSVMCRRTLFTDIGLYDPEMDFAEDYDLWCRASMQGKKFANLPEVLMRYRVHPGQVSSRKAVVQYGRDQAIKSKYYNHFAPDVGASALPRLLSLSTAFTSAQDLHQTIAQCLGPLARLSKAAPDMEEFTHILSLCSMRHFGGSVQSETIAPRPQLPPAAEIPPPGPFLLNYLKGGIGNQLFQQAFAISLSRRLGYSLRTDLSFYANDPYGNKSVAHRLFPEISETSISALTGSGHYMLDESSVKSLAEVAAFPADAKTVVLNGYWQGEQYFDRTSIEGIYSPLCAYGEKNAAPDLIRRLQSSTNSLALHIRRGDYAHMGLCKPSYYIAALEFLKKRYADSTVYLFSDEPNFSKHLLTSAGYGFECINGKDALVDLYLMSLCKHFVISNSTFSWWAAYFGEPQQGLVICPKEWVTIDSSRSPCPARWIHVEDAVTAFSVDAAETSSLLDSINQRVP